MIATMLYLCTVGNLYAASTVINLSTGWNNSSNSVYSVGAQDPDWQFLLNGTGTPITPYVDVANSTWNSAQLMPYPNQAFVSGGTHTYRFTFQNPYCHISQDPGDVMLYITYACGDDAVMGFSFNSGYTYNFASPPGVMSGDCNTQYSLQIPASAIQPGSNYIDFFVYNYVDNSLANTPNYLCLEASLQYFSTSVQYLNPSFTAPASVCLGSSVLLDGTTSTGTYSQHRWEMYECDQYGNVLSGLLWSNGWNTGTPGSVILPSSAFIGCNKYYKVYLMGNNYTIPSPCQPFAQTTKIIRVNCLPTVSAGPDQSTSVYNCVTISAYAQKGNTYYWTEFKNPTILSNTSSVTVCPQQTTTYCITATNYITGCSATDCMTIYIILSKLANPENESDGTVDGSPGEMNIFPNPATNKLSITYTPGMDVPNQIVITDLTGKTLFSKELNVGIENAEIDLRHLAAGTYFVSLHSSKGVITTKRFMVSK